MPYPLFYSYAYPEPRDFALADVQPSTASYDPSLHEFVLPYDSLRKMDEPERELLTFLQSTYEAAANLGGWDRKSLEVSAPV